MTQAQAYITNTSVKAEPGGARYYFTVDRTPSGPGDWCLGEPNETCSVTIGALPYQGSFLYHGIKSVWKIPAMTESLDKLFLRLQQAGVGFTIPYSSSIFVPSSDISKALCISFMTQVIYIGGVTAMKPVGQCFTVKPLPAKCDVVNTGTTPAISYQRLVDTALEGAVASTKIQLKCEGGDTKINISATRTDSFGVQLKQDGSLYSIITVNGRDATDGIPVEVIANQTTSVTIMSTLKTRGRVGLGDFSGSTVISLAPP